MTTGFTCDHDWRELDLAIKNVFEGGAKSVKSYLSIDHAPSEYPRYYNRQYYY